MNDLIKSRTGRLWSGIVIGVLIVIGVIAAFFVLRPEQKESIKVGAALPLSGPLSFTGQAVRDGLLLAVGKINSRGGVNGRKLKLIIADSKTNPQEGQKAFKEIEKAHAPLLYLSVSSSVSMALAPLAEENRVVVAGFAVTAQEFTAQNKWVFRYWPPAKAEIEPILFILQELDIKSLGILYLDDGFGRSVNALLKKSFERTGGVARSEPFSPKGADLKQETEKLHDTEGIYIVGFPVHTMNAIKIIRGTGFGGFVLATQVAATPEIISLPEASGVYVAAPIIYNPNYLFAKEAKDNYEARYTRPFDQFAAIGYDFVKLLASLLEDQTITRKNVKSLLEGGFMYSSVFGDLDVRTGERDIGFPLHPAQIVNGEIKYLR